MLKGATIKSTPGVAGLKTFIIQIQDHVLTLAPFVPLTEPSQKAFLPRAMTGLSGKESFLRNYF